MAAHQSELTNNDGKKLHFTLNQNSMSYLGYLFLRETHVSDDGLKHLRGFTNLKELHLENTQVTDEGVKKLQKALPDCEIDY